MNPGQQRRAASVSPALIPSANPFFGLLPQELWNKSKDVFIYSVEWTELAASETETQDIAVESDSDFLATAINLRAYDADSPETILDDNPFLVTIFDNGSGRRLMNRATHVDNFMGSGQLPGYLPFPKLFPRASTVSTTLQNLDTQNAYVVKLSYLGFKIFSGF